jgi:hypothetical protein
MISVSFLLVLGALWVGGLILVAYVVQKTRRSNLDEVQVLGRALGLPDGAPFLVERHARSFTARHAPSGKSTPASLTITTPVDETAVGAPAGAYRESGRDHIDLRPAIVLRPESAADRFADRLGVSRTIKTGDAAFDAAVHVSSDSPEQDVQRTLAAEGFREAVRALLASGAARVQLDDAGLSVVLLGPPPYVERFEHAAAQLAPAAAGLPLFRAGHVTKTPSPVALAVTFGIANSIAIVASVFALAGATVPLGSGATVVGGGGGVALWIVATLVAARVLRGRSTSLAQIAIFAFVTLFLVPASTYGAVCWVNAALDTSPAVEHPVTVTRAWATRSKSSVYHHVEVASWRQGEATEELSVSPLLASEATKGRRIVVTTHAGRLGWEWVETYRLAPQ